LAFRILTVCTGNVCRSPLAEHLLRARLASFGVETGSAGVRALVGSGMPAPALDLAARLNVPDAGEHVARQLTANLLDAADLILTMTRDQRRAVVEASPAATRRTFTLRELARITGGIADVDLRSDIVGTGEQAFKEGVALAAAMRGLVPAPRSSQELDVIDPYLQAPEVYERSGDEISTAVESLTAYMKRVARCSEL